MRDSQPVPPSTAGAMLRLDSWRVVVGLPVAGRCKYHPRLDQFHRRQRYCNMALYENLQQTNLNEAPRLQSDLLVPIALPLLGELFLSRPAVRVCSFWIFSNVT